MSIDPTLETLLLELMEEFDPSVDTSAGSAFRTRVANPFLTRIGGSPLEGDLELFLVERLDQEIEDIDTSPAAGIRDLVVRAMIPVQEPMRREIRAVKVAQSLNNFEQMTREELDALLGNYFTSLVEGGFAVGTARVLFPSPQSVVVTPLSQFSTGGGLNFFPSVTQQISSTQMSFNQDGDLFFFDVLLISEAAGDQYNIDPGEVNAVVGISGATRVTNLGKFEAGLDEETKAEAVARTRNSITIRNLITERGAEFVLSENFPQADVQQVIGLGDDEMRRDIISGPVDISDIPGGIAGKVDPGLGSGEEVHIGGKTDIYIYQRTPDLDDLDIQNVTDKGVRIFASVHGFTAAGAPTSTFEDEFGFFDKRVVLSGDLLLLGEDTFEVSSVSTSSVDIIAFGGGPSTIAAGLFGQTYEIVRRTAGFIDVPLYDMIAEDSTGNPVLDTDGDPVAPVPGALDKAQLLDSGGLQVKKIVNVVEDNVQLPLLRVTTAEFLDPLTLEASGVFVPMLDVLLAQAEGAFTGGDGATKATGTVRLWFRDAVNTWVTRTLARFTTVGSVVFQPAVEAANSPAVNEAPGTIGGSLIIIDGGDFTSSFAPGYRITLSGTFAGTFMVVGGAFNIGTGNTELTIRETLSATFSGADWLAHVGTTEALIQQDADTGLYFFDLAVEAILVGTSGNIADATALVGSDISSEGWTLKTTQSVLSLSTKELPYLRFTDWVNDTTELADITTARAVRASYSFASSLVSIQDFADAPANRIVAEEVLIRHFLTAFVRMMHDVDLVEELANQTAIDFINDLDPTEPLEVSDVSDAWYGVGATHVTMPLTLVGLFQDANRDWSVLFDQDSLGSDRVQHFIADVEFIEAM